MKTLFKFTDDFSNTEYICEYDLSGRVFLKSSTDKRAPKQLSLYYLTNEAIDNIERYIKLFPIKSYADVTYFAKFVYIIAIN